MIFIDAPFIVRCAAGPVWIRKTVGTTADLAFEGDGRSLRVFGVRINIAPEIAIQLATRSSDSLHNPDRA